MPIKVFWVSPVPEKCDTCPNKIDKVFFDAKTTYGPWACMCPTCQVLGPGLNKVGTGYGQKYEKQRDGRWKKTEG